MNVKRKFESSLAEFNVTGGVLIALSGGADSVCLLHLFANAKKSGTFPYAVEAAHLNHHLRGDEADRDAAFCRELCKRLGIPLTVCDADIGALAKASGKSIEEEARERRYEFLEATLRERGLSHIVTAHHRGDVCETMLLNLARGASIDGLCGIPRQRGNVIRPLLSASRGEILAYINENNLEFVTDSTNSDTKYSRNRVRLNILPEFEKLYCGYEENLERAARLLRRDADYLGEMADGQYANIVENGVLDTKKAQNVHVSLLTRIIKRLYNYHGYRDVSEAHIDAVCEKIYKGEENFILSLHTCTAICERGKLTFGDLPKHEDFSFEIRVGESVILPTGLKVSLCESRTDGAYPLKRSALGEKLTVRSRKDGDTIKFFGKTHKIKRVISDKKLSAEEKARLFFLVSDGEIIYSNMGAVADRAFVRKGESDCIFITVKDID